jgi:hypothetical protein
MVVPLGDLYRDFEPEVISRVRVPEPCRKFHHVGAVRFFRHIQETECLECTAVLRFI